jgi:hypothetical protein
LNVNMAIAIIHRACCREAVCATIRAVDDAPIFPVAASKIPVLARQSSRSLLLWSRQHTGKSIGYSKDRGVAGEFFPLSSRSYGKTGGAAADVSPRLQG